MFAGRGSTTSPTPPVSTATSWCLPGCRRALVGSRPRLVLTARTDGLRISEALGADIDRLGLERGHRTLVMHRRGGSTVTIPLAPRASTLDLAIGERLEGPIFLGHNGQRLTRDAAARMVQRPAKRAGITKRIGPHSLPHSFHHCCSRCRRATP